MINVDLTVSFWTDRMASKGKIRPKHGWGKGTVRVRANRSHGVKGGRPVLFNTMEQLPEAIEKALGEAAVKLHLMPTDRNDAKGRGR